MIKTARIIMLIFILLPLPGFSEEVMPPEKLKIAVFPVLNESGHTELNKASEKIKSVTEQTLLLLGNYTPVIENNPVSPESYYNYCTQNKIDYIFHGNLIKEERNIIVEISVYSRNSAREIAAARETAVSPVFLRDAVKKAVSGALEGITGEEISFTSLAFTNMTDEKGEYYVYIDDILFGKNVEYLETLLSGTRNVKILQERIFGTYNAGEVNAVLIPEDRVSIEFKIPPLLDREKKYIDRSRKTIDKHINDKYYSQKTAGSFRRLFKLLENPQFSDTATAVKEKYSEKYNLWLSHMEKWGADKGFTSADKPLSLGFKSMFLVSSFDITDWDMGGTDPDGSSGTSMGFGFTGSADIFKMLGIQAEVLVCNQKTKTLYPSGYPVLNLSEIETSTWFTEAPAIIYLRAPENLIKAYGGVSYKYRLTPLRMEGIVAGTGESVSEKYDDELMRMHLPSWLAGFAMEFPFQSSIFTFDFRYNRDFKSWFRNGTPEEDYIASYFAISLGYSAKY